MWRQATADQSRTADSGAAIRCSASAASAASQPATRQAPSVDPAQTAIRPTRGKSGHSPYARRHHGRAARRRSSASTRCSNPSGADRGGNARKYRSTRAAS